MSVELSQFKAEYKHELGSAVINPCARLKGLDANSSAKKAMMPSDTCRASGFSEFFSNIKLLLSRKIATFEVLSGFFESWFGWIKPVADKDGETATTGAQSGRRFNEGDTRTGRQLSALTAVQQEGRVGLKADDNESNQFLNRSVQTDQSIKCRLDLRDNQDKPKYEVPAEQILDAREAWKNVTFNNFSDEELIAFMSQKVSLFSREELLIPTHYQQEQHG